MTLAERLSEYVRACFSGIWIQSFEHDDAIAEIAQLCRQQGWSLATWDVDRGLSIAGRTMARAPPSAPPTRWPRSRRSARWPRRRARRSGAAELPPVPGQRRGRPGAGHGHRRRQAGPDDRRRPLAGRADPDRAGAASSW